MGVRGLRSLRVRAMDKGTPPLSSEGYVEITVGTAVGPENFRFNSRQYSVNLDEDARNGDTVNNLIII